MPSQVFSQSSSSQKKQSSISNFFTPKASAPSKTPSSNSRAPSQVLEQSSSIASNANANAPSSSDHDESPIKSRKPSFLKRAFSADDEENAAPDRRTSKRLRTPDDTASIGSDENSLQAESTFENISGPPNPLPKRSKVSERTSKYLFSTAPKPDNVEPEDEETLRQKAKLHDRFVKKLSRGDVIGDIRQQHGYMGEDGDDDEELDEDEEEEPAKQTKKRSSGLTPMEKQLLEIKRQHLDTLLAIQVGYKFTIFGEDARIASKELGMWCRRGKVRYDEHPSEAHLSRFASMSFPVGRLHVHVKRLVAAGHKVGVVRQLETAALKAVGNNRNTPFVRKLTELYTKSTYIDDIEALGESMTGPTEGAPATGHLLCITETNAKGTGTDEKVHFGIVAVQPNTGDIIYDDFEDGFMRTEFETRMLHIAPCEFLVVGTLSKATEKVLQHLSSSKFNVFGDRARIERGEKSKNAASESFSHISTFYEGKLKSATGDSDNNKRVLDKVHSLSEHVTICLSSMIKYLSSFSLEHVFDLTKNFQPFSARSHMLLNGNTLSSLEIYQNQTDHSEKGSLFWVLNQTQTRFGQRLLRKWVGRPLLDKIKLEERISAVEELKNNYSSPLVERIRRVLSKTKADLEKNLIRIYYKKCTMPELLLVLQNLQRIAGEFANIRSPSEAGFESEMINECLAALPAILEDAVTHLDKISTEAAKDNDKYNFFREEFETDSIKTQKAGITAVEQDLEDHKRVACDKLGVKSVDYVTVGGIDYLIEVENNKLKKVPASWIKISGTKKLSRFHTPDVVKFMRERDQHKESLAAACDEAFLSLLTDISQEYQSIRDAIQALATLDCLMSLAEVATRPEYVKPTFSDDVSINVKAGRHPMVEQLLVESYVPNDIALSPNKTRALLITGPNMGGKSSYVRQVALISIMGQIGSYVPAAAAELGILDAVFTRMGAFDNMLAGESTFMVELSETSDILKQATNKSLIILDELGRGTSTHDGVAIAQAVLDYFVRETKSLLLFITHYQSLSTVANSFHQHELRNMHMRFTEGSNDSEDITFLYELGEGTSHRSYGLNDARLANVPSDVISMAGVKSKELELDMTKSALSGLFVSLRQLTKNETDPSNLERLINSIQEL